MRVLLVEDDPVAREFTARGLERHGMSADLASDCASGAALALAAPYDVLILDVMLPDRSGFDLLQQIREAGVQTPALFLSARGAVADRVEGFAAGGDDYLQKPFALAELVARARALARRRWVPMERELLRVADLEIDLGARRVFRGGLEVSLSPRQFDLLAYLARNRGFALSRSMITENVWGHGFESRSNALDVQVNYLRGKIDRNFEPKLIHTVKGVGYMLDDRSGEARSGGR